MNNFRYSGFSTGLFITLLVIIAIVFFVALSPASSLYWLLFGGLWLIFLFKPMQELLYDNYPFLLAFFCGMTIFALFAGFYILLLVAALGYYCFWIYKRQQKIETEKHSAFFSSSDNDDPEYGMTSRARYEFHEWQHTLNELDAARRELQNLELRKSSMSEEEFEKEKRYLEFKVADWQKMADNQYNTYKQADS